MLPVEQLQTVCLMVSYICALFLSFSSYTVAVLVALLMLLVKYSLLSEKYDVMQQCCCCLILCKFSGFYSFTFDEHCH